MSSTSAVSSSVSPSGSIEVPSTGANNGPVSSHGAEDSSIPEESEAEKIRNIVASDLKTWQEKFAKASDKGAEDLEERVQELTDGYTDQQVRGVGESLLVELEDEASTQVANLKATMISIIEALPHDSDQEKQEQARDRLQEAIRTTATRIKDKAQMIRTWKQKSRREMMSLVDKATQSTVAVIDSIRDLGLQEVGMKWTWMDGISYKDWARFHELRKTFDNWREEVLSVAQQHEGLARAKDAADQVESKGMRTAEQSATELARLKDVARWKLETRDTTDDWSNKYMPPVVAKAGQVVIDKMKDAGQGVEEASGDAGSYASAATAKVKEAASSVSGQLGRSEPGVVEQATSKLSERVYGTPQPVGESAYSVVSSQVGEAASKISEVAYDSEQPTEDTYLSAMFDGLGNAASGVSEAVAGTSSVTEENPLSGASEAVESVVSRLSKGLSGDKTSSSIETASVSAHSMVEEASSAASKAPRRVWGGAAAQKVSDRQVHFDVDDDDKPSFSETVQSMVDEAGDRLSEMTRAVQEALFKTPTTQGSVESATSLASEQYSRALSAASSVLYGTQQGTGESIASVASKQYADAVAA